MNGGSAAGPTTPLRVVFICTHNSARSIMAEALLRASGGSRFEAFSAGTHASEIRPMTLRVLEDAGLPTDGLRSKSVDELLSQPFDYVVTVCDDAREVCPTFRGGGTRLHWSHEDPAVVTGAETERLDAFGQVFDAIAQRIDRFVEETR